MTRWVYDVETDGLYMEATRMWIISAWNLDEKKMYTWLEGDLGWQEKFSEATLLVGQNIIMFDDLIMHKLFNFRLPKTCNLHDTRIMSRILNYRRFGERSHGLDTWGDFFEDPKLYHDDWTQYSEEMRLRNLQDVRLNVRVYEYLIDEMKKAIEKNALIKPYMQAEHYVARWCAAAYEHGWPFNVEKGKSLQTVLEAEVAETTALLEHKLGYKLKYKDKEVIDGVSTPVVKKPKWVKTGFYDAHTSNWFGIDPASGFEGEARHVSGEYCRVEIPALKLSSSADVKIFLFRQGWEPTEFNSKWNPETKRKEDTSPKITEDSLEFLGGDGKLYKEYLSTSSRLGLLKGWLEATDAAGLLHGECNTVGTPSMRMTHTTIVNIPSGDAKYGRDMRELFGTLPGWKLIGCDSAGNQARGLAHFLEDQEYTDILLNGDIHTYNAEKLDAVLDSMGISWTEWIIKHEKVELEDDSIWHNYGSKRAWLEDGSEAALKAIAKAKRARAKRILYAFLFGASGKKLWSYVFDVPNGELGNKLKNGFTKAVPGFANLMKKLEGMYGNSKKFDKEPSIPSLVGNKIYVDSFHKLLVYLLQSTEKITCSLAIMLIMQRLDEAGIPYIPCIFMHDEADFMVPDEFAEQAAEIGRQAFKDGPAMVGITIMDGSKKLGSNWYEIH